jgi:hypothetical protein
MYSYKHHTLTSSRACAYTKRTRAQRSVKEGAAAAHAWAYAIQLVQAGQQCPELGRGELDGHLLHAAVDVGQRECEQERRLAQRREAAARPAQLVHTRHTLPLSAAFVPPRV